MNELATLGFMGCIVTLAVWNYLLRARMAEEFKQIRDDMFEKYERQERKFMEELERRVPSSQYPLKFEECKEIELKHLPLPIAHREFEFTDKIIKESKVEDFTFPVNRFGDVKEKK